MADTVRQKERKLGREKIKDSINRWIAQVPDLSTPHYEKDDDLMPPQAYDEIRELAKAKELQRLWGSSSPNLTERLWRDLQFFENWEIDLRLADLIFATEQHIHEDTVGTASGYAETVICCQKIRNVIETSLPFTVYCRLVETRINTPHPNTSHGIYKMTCKRGTHHQGLECHFVPPKEQNKLLAIIINQQSKIDRLENMLSNMANCTKANELRQQSEINRLESVLSDMDSRFKIVESTQVFRSGSLRVFLIFILSVFLLILLVGHEEDKSQVQVDNLIDLPKIL